MQEFQVDSVRYTFANGSFFITERLDYGAMEEIDKDKWIAEFTSTIYGDEIVTFSDMDEQRIKTLIERTNSIRQLVKQLYINPSISMFLMYMYAERQYNQLMRILPKKKDLPEIRYYFKYKFDGIKIKSRGLRCQGISDPIIDIDIGDKIFFTFYLPKYAMLKDERTGIINIITDECKLISNTLSDKSLPMFGKRPIS